MICEEHQCGQRDRQTLGFAHLGVKVDVENKEIVTSIC